MKRDFHAKLIIHDFAGMTHAERMRVVEWLHSTASGLLDASPHDYSKRYRVRLMK